MGFNEWQINISQWGKTSFSVSARSRRSGEERRRKGKMEKNRRDRKNDEERIGRNEEGRGRELV